MKRFLILAIAAYLAAVSMNVMDKQIYPLKLREELRIVPQKQIVEFLCLDHRGFAADMLFAQVNLHSGSLMWKPIEFDFDSDWSFGTMNLVTDLDPKYYTAYLFTGMGLIHRFSDVKLAQPILEKGMKIFPDSWELPFWIGYDNYNYLQDYDAAGLFLWEAYNKPDAPRTFLALMIGVFKKTGSYEQAYVAMKALMENSKYEGLKRVLAKKIIQLENLILLKKAGQVYLNRFGFPVFTLEDLVDVGVLSHIPEDPMGMKYVWNREKNIPELASE